MALTLELQKPEHWIIRDSQIFTTVLVPLSDYLSLVTFSSNIIGVVIIVDSAPETWDFAGWISQKIYLPFGTSTDSSLLNYHKLFLRRRQLIVFPDFLSPYQLSVSFPRWFPNVSVKIWEYVGPQINPVETKLDILLQKHSP